MPLAFRKFIALFIFFVLRKDPMIWKKRKKATTGYGKVNKKGKWEYPI